MPSSITLQQELKVQEYKSILNARKMMPALETCFYRTMKFFAFLSPSECLLF